MVHSQWECYTHNGHVTFTMGMLHSQWARYIHNGHVTFQMGSLHSKWACYIPNGHVTFQMGTLHSKWARYIPNGHVTFQMGTLHSKWARYIPNGHVTFQMGTLHSKWARYIPNGHVTSQMGMLHSKWACFMVRPLESLVEIRLDTQSSLAAMNLPSVGVPWLGLAAWLGVSMASSLVDSTENLSRLTAVFAELAPLPPCNSVWVDSFITSKVQAAIGLHRAHHSPPGV